MDLSIDKRERILAAASRLIVRNGLQCSMSAIAEEAGVATGSLYNYFDSKEALVRGVYGRVAEQMTERLSTPADPAATHEGRIKRYIGSYIDFIWEDALRARLFDYLDNTPFITLSDAQAIFGNFVDYAIQMIEAAQAAGVIRPGSATMLASHIRGAIRNSMKRRRLRPDPITPDELALIADMCWQALAAR
jgi:AcrR family transcriptional regulator